MNSYNINGQIFRSLTEVSIHYNINIHTLSCRLKKGMKIEEAIAMPVEHKIFTIEYNGQIYNGKQLAQLSTNDSSPSRIRRLIKRGWDIDVILHGDKDESGGGIKGNYYYEGKEYTAYELCKQHGKVNEPVFTSRLQEGWDLERALKTPSVGTGRRSFKFFSYKGKQYTMKELSEMSGIPYGALRQRILYYGWDVERAMTQPLQQKRFS